MGQGEPEIHALQYLARQSQAAYITTHFSVTSPPQYRSQVVVCVSTPRMYLKSRYYIVLYKSIIELLPTARIFILPGLELERETIEISDIESISML